MPAGQSDPTPVPWGATYHWDLFGSTDQGVGERLLQTLLNHEDPGVRSKGWH